MTVNEAVPSPHPGVDALPGAAGADGALESCSVGSAATSPSYGLWHAYQLQPFLKSVLLNVRSEIEELLSIFWLPATVFVVAELGSLLILRRSVFVNVTSGAFDVGPRYAAVVEVHIWASALMWALGGAQITCQRLRKNPATVWVHRRAGEFMLSLFFLIVFPTSLYLSVLQRIDYLASAVCAVLFDTALCTAYFLLCGWHVARRRLHKETSLQLHGRLMQCAVMMSMSILPQRFLQAYLTSINHFDHQLNYTVSILVTSILFLITGHFAEGPRGGIWLCCIGEEHAAEAYGSTRASKLEACFWKGRWLLYMVVYKLLRFVAVG